MKNCCLEKLKNELYKSLDNDILITFDNVVYGSFLGSFNIIIKKIKTDGKKIMKKFKDLFAHKK